MLCRTGASGGGTGPGAGAASSAQNTHPGGGGGQDGSGCHSVVGVKPAGTGHPGGGTKRTAMGPPSVAPAARGRGRREPRGSRSGADVPRRRPTTTSGRDVRREQ
ncbi:Uncharacterised protein [Mycobacteroides abscessus]|nr:Uncharacterised protein [Mycobacteroides abscessus]